MALDAVSDGAFFLRLGVESRPACGEQRCHGEYDDGERAPLRRTFQHRSDSVVVARLPARLNSVSTARAEQTRGVLSRP